VKGDLLDLVTTVVKLESLSLEVAPSTLTTFKPTVVTEMECWI